MSPLSLRAFKAIIFDLDSTLMDTQQYPLDAGRWLFSRIVDDPAPLIKIYFAFLVRYYRDEIRCVVEEGRYKRPFDVVKDATKSALAEMEIEVMPELLEEGIRVFKNLHVEKSIEYPGAREFLSELKEYVPKLGVITNSFEGHAEKILRNADLFHFFNVVVDGADVNTFKPDPWIFEFTLEKLGTTSSETLYIGDEYNADIFGASQVGMKTVWINNRGQDLEELVKIHGEDSRPLLVLENIAQLTEYI